MKLDKIISGLLVVASNHEEPEMNALLTKAADLLEALQPKPINKGWTAGGHMFVKFKEDRWIVCKLAQATHVVRFPLDALPTPDNC